MSLLAMNSLYKKPRACKTKSSFKAVTAEFLLQTNYSSRYKSGDEFWRIICLDILRELQKSPSKKFIECLYPKDTEVSIKKLKDKFRIIERNDLVEKLDSRTSGEFFNTSGLRTTVAKVWPNEFTLCVVSTWDETNNWYLFDF